MDTKNILALESALRLIREVCNYNDDCESCPLRSHNIGTKLGFERCMVLEDYPSRWVLKSDDPNEAPLRIFK